MNERLDRGEAPIQDVSEYNERDRDSLTATVPVHLEIFGIPVNVRTDKKIIGDVREVVKEWYNQDMLYHLKCLEGDDVADLSLVRGFEKFGDNWGLEGVADEGGFLRLVWKNNGRIDQIAFCRAPVILYNQWDENKQFYTRAVATKNQWIELITRGLRQSECMFMTPEKMKRYGVETEISRIRIEEGVAEVMGHAFCSEYLPNMPRALLLRDFAVAYLNRLLEISK